MCFFHDLHCKRGAKDTDCAIHLKNRFCGDLDEKPERIPVLELCVKCQLERFRWPEVDV